MKYLNQLGVKRRARLGVLFKLFIPFVISAEQSDVNGKLDVPDIFPQPPRNLKRVILSLTVVKKRKTGGNLADGEQCDFGTWKHNGRVPSRLSQLCAFWGLNVQQQVEHGKGVCEALLRACRIMYADDSPPLLLLPDHQRSKQTPLQGIVLIKVIAGKKLDSSLHTHTGT